MLTEVADAWPRPTYQRPVFLQMLADFWAYPGTLIAISSKLDSAFFSSEKLKTDFAALACHDIG